MTFSRDSRLSPDDTRVQVRWMPTEQFRQWLEREFPTQYGLPPSVSQAIVERMLRGTAGNKQYYPIILQP
jgi:hypothetical protein